VKTKRAGFLGALESLMNINSDGEEAEEDDSTSPRGGHRATLLLGSE
jgi:hypothetical protein